MKKIAIALTFLVAACSLPSKLVNYSPRYDDYGTPVDGKGVVAFSLSHLGKETKTYWGRVEDGKPTGQRLYLTRTNSDSNTKEFLNAQVADLMLEPGVYYLNGFVLENQSEFKKNNMGADYDINFGWDETLGKPVFLGFEVKAAEKFRLPDIELTYRVTEDGNTFYYVKETKEKLAGYDDGSWIIGTKMNKAK